MGQGNQTIYNQARKNMVFNYRVRDAEKNSEQCPQFKATKEEIERYKKETGKIKGGGANLNLPYNPITGGRIYKKQTHYPQDQAESFGSPRARYWRKKEVPYHPKGDSTIHGQRLPPQLNQEGAFHPLGKNRGDVWAIPTQPFSEAHFATFPEKLVEPMILAGCPTEGIVLDPFAGSGTVAVVAKKLGRDFIGIDISEKYCVMARRRLSKIPERLDRWIS
jgi:hypothetical protein